MVHDCYMSPTFKYAWKRSVNILLNRAAFRLSMSRMSRVTWRQRVPGPQCKFTEYAALRCRAFFLNELVGCREALFVRKLSENFNLKFDQSWYNYVILRWVTQWCTNTKTPRWKTHLWLLSNWLWVRRVAACSRAKYRRAAPAITAILLHIYNVWIVKKQEQNNFNDGHDKRVSSDSR